MKKQMKVLRCALLLAAVLLGCGVLLPVSVQAAEKAEYYYKTYDRSETYHGKCTIVDHESYKRVILKGDSDAVKKINKTLKKACDEALKNMPTGYAEEIAKNSTDDAEYYNEYTSKVTYNNHNIISILVSYEWYQGGVADYGCDGYTFDLETGKQLKLTDVCSGSNKKLTETIKKKLIKKAGEGVISPDSMDKISAADADFYLKKGNKAVVCYDKYEIADGAAGAFLVTLKSKYK